MTLFIVLVIRRRRKVGHECSVKGCAKDGVAFLEDKKQWLCRVHWLQHRKAAGLAMRKAAVAPSPPVAETEET